MNVLKHLFGQNQSKFSGVEPAPLLKFRLILPQKSYFKTCSSYLFFIPKKAAGNRNYKGEIKLPALNKLENLKDSKDVLHSLLREASGLKKRNLKTFNVNAAVHLVSENISDFSSLRSLTSFLEFEQDVKKVVADFLEKKAS